MAASRSSDRRARAAGAPSAPALVEALLAAVGAPSALALAAALLAAPAVRAAGDSALASYRELARSPASARVLAFARAVMESRWSGARVADADAPEWPGAPPHELYVSLVDGSATRACVGRAPAGPLAASLRALALEALSADPRHPPVRRDELARLRLVLAFAGEGEVVADPMSVNPAREGLRLEAGGRSVAFLPGEARTVAWALRSARRAGLLAPGAPVTCSRFPVVTVAEPLRSRASRGDSPHADE